MEIKIDSREHGKHGLSLTRKDRAFEYYTTKGHTANIELLDYGDYLFNDKIVYEYKTINDFMSSIYNNSLLEEAVNQAKHYPYHYVIIVGNIHDYIQEHWSYYITRKRWEYNYQKYLLTNLKAYSGSVRKLNTFTCCIYASDEIKAFHEMLLQSMKCLDGKIYGGTKRPIPGQDIIDHSLMGAGNVSVKRCKDIRKTLNIKSVDDLMACSVEDFNSVRGIGVKTAHNLYEWLHEVKGEQIT